MRVWLRETLRGAPDGFRAARRRPTDEKLRWLADNSTGDAAAAFNELISRREQSR